MFNYKITNANLALNGVSELSVDFYQAKNNCDKSKLFSIKMVFTMIKVFGSPEVEIGIGENINLNVQSIQVMPTNLKTVALFKLTGECGISSWKMNKFSEITGQVCGSAYGFKLPMPEADELVKHLFSLDSSRTPLRAYVAYCNTNECYGPSSIRPINVVKGNMYMSKK